MEATVKNLTPELICLIPTPAIVAGYILPLQNETAHDTYSSLWAAVDAFRTVLE